MKLIFLGMTPIVLVAALWRHRTSHYLEIGWWFDETDIVGVNVF